MMDNTSTISVIGMELAQISSFRTLSINCKEIDMNEPCEKISTLLMHDKALINQLMGYGILEVVQKTMDNDETILKDNRKRKDKLVKSLSCYMSNTDVYIAQMFNKEMSKQYILDAKQLGEVNASKNLAFNVYNTIRQHGFNPDFNPNDCK